VGGYVVSRGTSLIVTASASGPTTLPTIAVRELEGGGGLLGALYEEPGGRRIAYLFDLWHTGGVGHL
jgi:hypothetical protein